MKFDSLIDIHSGPKLGRKVSSQWFLFSSRWWTNLSMLLLIVQPMMDKFVHVIVDSAANHGQICPCYCRQCSRWWTNLSMLLSTLLSDWTITAINLMN